MFFVQYTIKNTILIPIKNIINIQIEKIDKCTIENKDRILKAYIENEFKFNKNCLN